MPNPRKGMSKVKAESKPDAQSAEVVASDEPDKAVDPEEMFPVLSVIDLRNYDEVVDLMGQHERMISKHPKEASKYVAKFLSFHMNIFELEPQESGEESSLSPKKITYSLMPVAKVQLKRKSLAVLTELVTAVKSAKLFACWYAFLPRAPTSPYRLSIFDLLSHPDYDVRMATLKLVNVFFQNSSTYLQLANFHCRVTSFTPVCYHFAVSLGALVEKVCDCFELPQKHPEASSSVSKTMITLLEQVPFHRLRSGVLGAICGRLLRLKPDANPVIQIAVLQVCSALLAVDSKANLEIKEVFGQFFDMFTIRLFPDPASLPPLINRVDPNLQLDSNICYFAIQCLGKLALLDRTKFMECLDTFPLLKASESVLANGKDTSLCLHILRLFRTVGTNPSKLEVQPAAASDDDIPPAEVMIKFWKEVVKPSVFDYVERREQAILRAALCDCLTEIGEAVFSILPQDRRVLCQTYLLTKCRILDPNPENRIVTTSQIRAIGRMMLWPSCYSDSAFVTDSAEILLEVLNKDLKVNSYSQKTVALSGTWSLANLAGVLAMQFSNAATLGDDDEYLSCLSANNDQLEFPPHLTVELASVAIKYAKVATNLMNIRTSSVRALGCFVRCLDGIYTDIPGMATNSDFIDVCSELITTIKLNVESGRAMKVRWNACYAASNCLKPLTLFRNKRLAADRSELICALLPLIEDFPNFKVRTSAAFAVSCATSKGIFNGGGGGEGHQKLSEICLTTIKGLDSMYDAQEEGEGQHKADLVDQLCLTFCHLIMLADASDVQEVNSALLEHSPETLVASLDTVMVRISPEKGSVIVKTMSKMNEMAKSQQLRKPAHHLESDQADLFTIFANLDINPATSPSMRFLRNHMVKQEEEEEVEEEEVVP